MLSGQQEMSSVLAPAELSCQQAFNSGTRRFRTKQPTPLTNSPNHPKAPAASVPHVHPPGGS